MPARTLPNLGLQAFFTLGEDGWNDEYDNNWLKTSVVTQGSCGNILALEPASPVDGEIWIINETHTTQANKIIVRDAGAWVYITPKTGWLFYNTNDGNYLQFTGTLWRNFRIGPMGAEQVPALGLGWIGLGGAWANPSYRKSADGMVTISGAIQRAVSAQDGVIFTLLAGYRPAADLIFVGFSAGGAFRIDVKANGDVEIAGSNHFFSSFSGVSFFAG
jgi:hypothetical protein